jgi:hypothetical protein
VVFLHGCCRGLAAALVAFVLLFLPASALADAPACPDPAGEYSGSDPVVSEQRLARADERTVCLVIVDRLDRAHDDAAAAAAAAHDAGERAHTETTALGSSVDGVTAAVRAIPTPVPPAEASPYDGPTPAQLDDAARTLHGDFWLLLGAGAALVFGVPFVRMATPWWRS